MTFATNFNWPTAAFDDKAEFGLQYSPAQKQSLVAAILKAVDFHPKLTPWGSILGGVKQSGLVLGIQWNERFLS